uniref:Uncharacterized protein n=1 Tax=Arundo donax TaxID=35708 RepID=A0A0A9C5H6_ARUDO
MGRWADYRRILKGSSVTMEWRIGTRQNTLECAVRRRKLN